MGTRNPILSAMTVLLQDILTAKYLAADGHWVASAVGAQKLPCFDSGLRDWQNQYVRPVRVVFHFADVKYSINVMNGVGTAVPAAARQSGHFPAQA